MKKLLVLSALAAVSAAFVACSNENDLVQLAPVVPEETVVGTPFTISTGADTRATLYNANAWDKSNSTTWVSDLKLYGKQGSNDPWMNSVIFHRDAYDGDWAPNRSASEASLSTVNWPTADKTTPTSFYAITDNAIGAGTTAAIAGVSEWMSTVGTFSYTMPKTAIDMDWIDPSQGNGFFDTSSTDYADATAMTDLMVATAESAETSNGVLPLAFTHALSGLTIKVMFLSNDAEGKDPTKIYSIKICGLNSAAKYTYGTGWSDWTTPLVYYKSFATPIEISAEKEDVATPNEEDLVLAGEWLVIPQTTSPWDGKKLNGTAVEDGKAYVALRIEDGDTGDDVELYYPLSVTLNPAKNKVLKIDLGQFREPYDSKDGTNAAFYYEPTSVAPIP